MSDNEDINFKIDAELDLANYELKSAKILLDAGQYRDSITHSYYAMYSSAKALLLTKNYITKTHEGLIMVFGREFVRDGDFSSEIFAYLTDARSMRKDTSYDSLAKFSKDDAEEKYFNALEFIAEIEKFL
ncbi:HEPN domain-containing protein [Methanobrevibacter sp.]|uniref:HEPN domain-containing protein n=1 Tax=Methanobrevibacter sp. TaxID=66852 RepID=UPI00388E503E